MVVEVRRYTPALSSDWSAVLRHSRNGVFLFDRRYMEYHGDRFVDISAVAYVKDKPVAFLPASIDERTQAAYSHAGLTFGGIVLSNEIRSDVAIEIVFALLDALKTWGVGTLTVKLLPSIFMSYPSSDVEYALWRRGFSLVRRDLSSAIPLNSRFGFNKSKLQAVAKAKKSGIALCDGGIPEFHALLSHVLMTQHGTTPVHSLDDLQTLTSRFPEHIVLRSAVLRNEMAAATLVFKYGRVWHTQYLATSDAGRERGALDLVVHALVEEATLAGANHLSFGISTEDAGTRVNQGLLWQKESYGARSIIHDFVAGRL